MSLKTYSCEWAGGCHDISINKLKTSGDSPLMEKAILNKSWLLTPAILRHSSSSPREPFPDWDICKLSTPINSCLVLSCLCSCDCDSEKVWCIVFHVLDVYSIRSHNGFRNNKKIVTAADECWSKNSFKQHTSAHVAVYIRFSTSYLVLSLTSPDSLSGVLQSLNSISGSKSLSLPLG